MNKKLKLLSLTLLFGMRCYKGMESVSAPLLKRAIFKLFGRACSIKGLQQLRFCCSGVRNPLKEALLLLLFAIIQGLGLQNIVAWRSRRLFVIPVPAFRMKSTSW
jgi:hypothetical protein